MKKCFCQWKLGRGERCLKVLSVVNRWRRKYNKYILSDIFMLSVLFKTACFYSLLILCVTWSEYEDKDENKLNSFSVRFFYNQKAGRHERNSSRNGFVNIWIYGYIFLLEMFFIVSGSIAYDSRLCVLFFF